jgi:hypothetical protein
MSELKTQPTNSSVDAFLDSAGEQRRPDCDRLVEMMSRATDIDTSVLEELVTASVAHMQRAYAPGAPPT